MAKLSAGIIDVVSFRSLFGMLCRDSNTLRFKIDKDGIRGVSMSRDMATCLNVLIKPEFFTSWKFEGDFMFCFFDAKQFTQMMKNLNSKSIEMVIDENYINFDVVDGKKKKHISLVQITGELEEEIGNLGTECEFSWSTDIAFFKSVIDDVINVDEDKDLSSIYFSWTNDNLKIEAKENRAMKFETNVSENFNVTAASGHSSFRTRYFSSIIWAGLGDVKFSIMHSDGPAILENVDVGKFHFKFIAAPFVSGDY